MSDNRIIECMERAQYLLGNLMAVKPGEEVLIVVDPQTDERMTQAMAAAALNCGAEYGNHLPEISGTWHGCLRCICRHDHRIRCSYLQ